MKRSLMIAALMSLVVGCSFPYKVPQFNARQGTPPAFPGVTDLLAKAGTLDVLLVHGMCTHDADWAVEAVESLYSSMGGDTKQVSLKPVAVKDTNIVLFQQTLPLPSGSLRVNAILWSPLTTPLKADLCYDQTNKSISCPIPEAAKAYPYKRAGFNRDMKDGLLNDCLSDALIYQGNSRTGINERMQAAILQAVNANVAGGANPATGKADAVPGSTSPIVLITDSLGSKVTFDAIFKLANSKEKDSEKTGIHLFNRTALVFMRANQMPLLALADKYLDGSVKPEKDDSGFPADPIQALIQLRNSHPLTLQSKHVPTVVAFSDPNDLLSYALVGSPHAARAAYPIVDVIVSNAASYFNYVELPNKAHSDYGKNDAVRQLIACGHPQSTACKSVHSF